MLFEGGCNLIGGNAESDMQLRMQARGKVDRNRASENQGDQKRFMQVARDDDFVAGTNRGQQKGVISGGGAVEQKEAAVGAPGVGSHRFRHPQGLATKVGVADPAAERYVAAEGRRAKDLPQLRISAQAELVTWGRKGNDALFLIRTHPLEQRNPPVVDRSAMRGQLTLNSQFGHKQTSLTERMVTNVPQ
jgi:hypothetical protein